MTVKTEFEVTEKAGNFVAGRRSPGKGGKIALTEDEAHFALAAGELKRPGATSGKKPKGKDSPPAGDPPGGGTEGGTETLVENPPVVTE
jgi:hypothetical protein